MCRYYLIKLKNFVFFSKIPNGIPNKNTSNNLSTNLKFLFMNYVLILKTKKISKIIFDATQHSMLSVAKIYFVSKYAVPQTKTILIFYKIFALCTTR